jgi:hypothetical protein
VVREALTPLNYVLAVEAAVWFVERAAAEHPAMKVCVLRGGGGDGWRLWGGHRGRATVLTLWE